VCVLAFVFGLETAEITDTFFEVMLAEIAMRAC
jgi:hypothetical protein